MNISEENEESVISYKTPLPGLAMPSYRSPMPSSQEAKYSGAVIQQQGTLNWDPFGSTTGGGGIGSSSSNGDCFIVENFEMWPCEEEEVAYDVLICHTLDIHLDHPAVQQKMIIVILSHRASEEKVSGQ